MKFLTLSILSLSIATSPAMAEMVTIQVFVLPGRTPIPAVVERLKGDMRSPLGEVDSMGSISFDEPACTIETTYVVTPRPKDDFLTRVKPQKPCTNSAPIAFEFYQKKFAAVLSPVLESKYPATWVTVAGINQVAATIDSFVAAGDYGTAAILGVETGIKLRAEGKYDIAKTYEEIGAFYGISAVLNEAPSDQAKLDWFNYDSGQGRYVINQTAAQAIRDYQSQKGLKVTGTLDWRTMFAASELGQNNALALAKLKNETISSFQVLPY